MGRERFSLCLVLTSMILRLSNRMAGGEGICHHGGPESTAGGQSGPFDRAVWTLLPSSSSKFFSQGTAEGSSSSSGAAGSSGGDGVSANTASNAPEVAPAGSEAIFALESPAGDQGFPGALRVEARISVQPPSPSPSSGNAGSLGAISLVYRAMLLPTDPPCAGTPLNLTHHWGFNLSASSSASAAARAEEGLVDEHVLTLTPPQGESLRLLALDSQGIPTGELRAVNEGTAGPHDWVGAGRGKRIGAAMPECGYDHFYILGPAASEEEAKNVRAELESASTGLAVRFRTNQTGVQLYTANGQPVSGLPSSAAGGSRKHLHVHPRPSKDAKDVPGNATRSAAFLEFGHPHATFLNPETLGKAAGTDTILRPGEVYENWVTADVCWRERIGAQ